MEFYASPERARMLRAEVKDLLMYKMTANELHDIKINPAFDVTPTYSKIKERLTKKGKD